MDVISGGTAVQLELLGLDAMVLLGRGMLACEYLMKLKRQVRPYAADVEQVDRLFDDVLPLLGEKLAENRLGEALRPLVRALNELEPNGHGPKPVVGVAGDPYTRVHAFGNTGMFDRLEQLGLEVWPHEPGYKEVLSLAGPYVDPGGNENLLVHVAKMLHFAENGASGIINAISINCMLGTVAASFTERIRQDNDMIPISTISFSGRPSPRIDAGLEAFAHQVKQFARRRDATA